MVGLRLPTAKTEVNSSPRHSDFTWNTTCEPIGRSSADDVSSYVCESVSQNIRGILTENTNRISKLMFKWSVELNMMMHIVAAHFKDDVSDLRALRGYSADEVKRTYGNISFDTALDIQRGNSDD